MANIAFVRVQKECKEIILCKELQDDGVTIEPLNETLFEIVGKIRGPPDSPYEDGLKSEYRRSIHSYLQRLNLRHAFGTRTLEQWAASMTLRTVLLSVQLLLLSPEPSDPQDAIVAKQCMSDPALFKSTAKYWSQHYASAPGDRDKNMAKSVSKLEEMGATMDASISALSCYNWNLAKATEFLFT
uniref:UBA domain-containing protein n=1 Tax=Globodera pallida TaxID=36090 RepID=A0A183CNW8_GLOPA